MAEKFTGKEGAMISLSKAREMFSNYKSSPNFKANKEVKGIFYGRDHLQALLDQKDCMGIRIYYGIEQGGAEQGPQMILLGADENMNDMISGKILDFGMRCPHFCPSGDSLDG